MIPEKSASQHPDFALSPLPADLPALARDINAAFRAAQEHAKTAVECAVEAGTLLLRAKAAVHHGQWLPWLAANCPDIAERTAQAYMRLAREQTALHAKSATVADLTINEALRLLTGPEPEATADWLDTAPAAFHDRITGPTLPATPAPAASRETVAALLAELPAEDKRAVMNQAAATDGLKVVRAEARYLHVSQARHEWYTPADYLAAARTVMGDIDLDPASCIQAQETVCARRFFTKETDGLAHPWDGRVWLNPPFESELIRPFIAKLLAEYRAGNVAQAIVLTDNATDTSWFHDLSAEARRFCFTKGRIKFISPLTDAQAPQRGQVFTYIGDRAVEFTERFSEFGLVVLAAQEARP